MYCRVGNGKIVIYVCEYDIWEKYKVMIKTTEGLLGCPKKEGIRGADDGGLI